jgi:4-amino-4-deoxy-L-arabinose transferase-like glycosyltransferase
MPMSRSASQDSLQESSRVEKPLAGSELSERVVRLALFAILGAGLLVRLLHFAAIRGTAFPRIPLAFTSSDMYAVWRWAESILAGDFLGRSTPHPYFGWMQAIAPLETWYRWWGGKEIFQQAPLYTYWVAALLGVSGHSLSVVLLAQLLVGSLQPLVMFALGRRLFDARVGLGAAALTALYGPVIFYQGALLRDWLPLLLEPLALLLLLRAHTQARGRDWVWAGAALGVALLAKETVLLFLPLVLLWLCWEQGGSWRKGTAAAAWLLAGLLMAVSPLLARNAVVGAPLFALSNRAAEGFIIGNAADGFPIGFDLPLSMKRILSRTDGRLVAVVRETLDTYDGDWRRLVDLQLLKLRGLVDPVEVPDNLAYSYGLEISPVLRLMLRYGAIFPLGVAGFLLVLNGWREHLLLCLYGLSTVGGLMFSIVHARYRLALVPVLIVYGAAGAVRWIESVWMRRVGTASAYGGLIVALIILQQWVSPVQAVREMPGFVVRPQEHVLSAEIYASDSRFDRAAMEIERLRTKTPDRPEFADLSALTSRLEGGYRADWARQLLEQGRREEARRQTEKAEILYRGHRQLSLTRYKLGLLYFNLNDAAKAKAFLQQFLELEPQGPRAEGVRRLLSHLGGAP